MGTELSAGGLWRVTAVSVCLVRARNFFKFHAAGSRRRIADIQISRQETLNVRANRTAEEGAVAGPVERGVVR